MYWFSNYFYQAKGKKIFIFWLNMTGHSLKIFMKTYLPDLGKFVMIRWIKESRKSSSMSL